MKTKTLVILILVALAAVLLLQNAAMTQLSIFLWPIYAPLFILLLVFFFLGIGIGRLMGHREKKKDAPKNEGKTLPASLVPPAPAAKPHP